MFGSRRQPCFPCQRQFGLSLSVNFRFTSEGAEFHSDEAAFLRWTGDVFILYLASQRSTEAY